MIKLPEMQQSLPVLLHDGARSTTTEVWNILAAARDGDLERVSEMVNECGALLTCQYNYTPPIHFAVREGHFELVQYLVENGGLDPTYRTYPFGDSLVTMARDRGFADIARLLEDSGRHFDSLTKRGACGEIQYGFDEEQRRFEQAVHGGEYKEAKRMLEERADLATNPNASWGEGILMMPARERNRKLLDLLMSHGARVPNISKWGRFYYFKHYDIAAHLVENGMSAKHMSWHEVTLLHDMAQKGDLDKASLLIDHGADIDAIDDEYRSTPLGFATRWGQREMVNLLLERGADPNRSGSDWASPLAWSRKKAFPAIEKDLVAGGAAA